MSTRKIFDAQGMTVFDHGGGEFRVHFCGVEFALYSEASERAHRHIKFAGCGADDAETQAVAEQTCVAEIMGMIIRMGYLSGYHLLDIVKNAKAGAAAK